MARLLTILLFVISVYHYRCDACKDTFLTKLQPTSSLLTQWEDGYNKWQGHKEMLMGDGKKYKEFFVLHPFHPKPGQKLAHRTYALDGKYQTFSAIVGPARLSNGCEKIFAKYGSFSIKILVDGKQKYFRKDYGKTGYDSVHIDVNGAKTLKIETDTLNSKENADCDHSAIAKPFLKCNNKGIALTANIKCPTGSLRVKKGKFNDISGCGLEGCDKRYKSDYDDIDACKHGCDNYANNHPGINIYRYI